MCRRLEITNNVTVAGVAGFRSDELRAGNTRRRHDGALGRARQKDNGQRS